MGVPSVSTVEPGEHWLTVVAILAQRNAWGEEGHVLSTAQKRVADNSSREAARNLASPEASSDGDVLGDARFDTLGNLISLGRATVSGGDPSFFRAPTENDLLDAFGSFELGDPATTMGLGAPGSSSAARWREAGLDKLQTRVVSVKADEDALTFVRRIAPASQNISIEVTQRWSWSDDGLRCEVRVEPSEGWTVTWPRAGVHFELPLGCETASWFGTGPEENYPDSQAAAIVSGFSSPIDDLGVRYAVPQETGHRGDLRKLRLQGSDLPDVVVTTELVNGRRPGFSVTRHTPDVVAGASHLHRLPEPTATHLWLDLAVHGLGSRSCGPDVLPKYALWPRVLEGTFTLSAQ